MVKYEIGKYTTPSGINVYYKERRRKHPGRKNSEYVNILIIDNNKYEYNDSVLNKFIMNRVK